MDFVIFYKISDGTVLSYVSYIYESDGEGGYLNIPSKQKCASNNNLSEESIGMKKWSKEIPQESDFKSNINDIPSGEEIEDL